MNANAVFHDDLIHPKPNGFKLNKSDVWGKWDEQTLKSIDNGMIVARGLPSDLTPDEADSIIKKTGLPRVCPVWGDLLPYKSVTAICDAGDAPEVMYWLSYVHGGGYEKTKRLPDGRMAIRSNYQAW